MTPGQFLLKFYHTPFNRLRDCLREGGPFEQRRTEAGRREMEAAAHTLPVLPVVSGPPLELHLLTGLKTRADSDLLFFRRSDALVGACGHFDGHTAT